MINFNQFISVLKSDLSEIAREYGEEYVNDMISDGCQFARTMKVNLERRSRQLSCGELTKKEFELLLKSDRALIKMAALKKKGLTVVQLNRIRNAIVQAISGAVFKSLNI